MVQSRSDEAKKYRDKQRIELGDDEYKRLQTYKRRASRARLKVSNNQIEPVVPAQQDLKEIITILNKILIKKAKVDIPFVETLVKEKVIPIIVNIGDQKNCGALKSAVIAAKFKLAKQEGKIITRKTIDQQFNKVMNLYRLINGKQPDCKSLDFLKDTDTVIEAINSNPKWKTANSRNAQIQAIASILRVLKGFEKEYKFYSNLSTAGRKSILKDSESSTTTAKEKKNILPWSKLKNLYKLPNLTLREKALIGLYTLNPPRRVEMSQWLQIAYDDKKLDKNFNYLIVNEETNEPQKIIMLKYKTFKTFGRQELEIPNILKKILKKFIDDEGIDEKQPIFNNSHGEHYRNFNSIVTRVFKKATGKKISVNLLRHAYISNFLSKRRSIREKKELALAMGHSVATQQQYDRIDIDDVDEIKD